MKRRDGDMDSNDGSGDPADHEEGARSFTRALEMIADGDLVFDAGAELHKLLADLQAEARVRHGAVTGTLTLKLSLSVEPHGVVEIKPALTTKAADRRLTKGVLWLTPGANLTAENPRQQVLPLREVPKGEPARDVNDGTKGAKSAREV